MTSPLASVALFYDGVDLQQADLQIFLEVIRGIGETPTVRGLDVVIPALAGRKEYNRVNDVLAIELHGFVRADPTETTTAGARATFAANRSTIRTLFASDRERADLIVGLEDGTVLSVSARPMPTLLWDERVKSEFAYVNVELEGYGDWVEVTGS